MLEAVLWRLAGSGPLAAVVDFLNAGGPVLLLVGAAGLILWVLILERWFYLRFIFPRMEQHVLAEWRKRSNRRSWSARRVREAMIRRVHAKLSSTLPLIQTLIAACPLLGLLGTVTGMIAVFDVVALVGTGDAEAMAAGVSRATIPTMAGMVVGISGLFPLYRFSARVRQATDRIADRLDTRGAA
ncbi:MAG: MotA/TolQ/ExbB proton channel family protein [Algiphilus sp.]